MVVQEEAKAIVMLCNLIEQVIFLHFITRCYDESPLIGVVPKIFHEIRGYSSKTYIIHTF